MAKLQRFQSIMLEKKNISHIFQQTKLTSIDENVTNQKHMHMKKKTYKKSKLHLVSQFDYPI